MTNVDMSEQKIVRVRDVMKPEFDMVDGMMTVREALDSMKHVETKTLIVINVMMMMNTA